jgi:hypothetical protein
MTVDKLLYLLGPLGCAAMMGAMMWMMRRPNGNAAQPDVKTQAEIAALRTEITTLRAAQGDPAAAQPAQERARTGP